MSRTFRSWVLSAAVFVLLVSITFLVWRQQVHHKRSLLTTQTEDVCVEAARRLEVFMESHLRVASIFARRWSTHETRDFSRQRFDEFATVLVDELPGYYAIGMVGPDTERVWVQPAQVPLARVVLDSRRRGLIERARTTGQPVLSAPFASSQGATTVYILLPLHRGEEFLGTLVIDIRIQALVDDCFHSRIRSKFHFKLQDGGEVIFRSAPEATDQAFAAAAIGVERRVGVRNRTWRLSMVPRPEKAAGFGWFASLPVPLLGLFLSIGFSVLVFMLLRRVEAVQAARDQQAMLARKVLLAQEEERARISRELHDELGQLLTALRLETGWLQKRLAEDDGEGRGVFSNTVQLVEQATGELRRMCRGLRPPLLDDLGLEPAVRQLVDEFQARRDLEIELEVGLDEGVQLGPEVALCTYRILQEALTNASRHARARRVAISLVADARALTLDVKDDGVGFDPVRMGDLQGCGLEGMRERAHLAGGRLELHAASGQGTRVCFQVSLTAAAGE